jgi:hypothetical protein
VQRHIALVLGFALACGTPAREPNGPEREPNDPAPEPSASVREPVQPDAPVEEASARTSCRSAGAASQVPIAVGHAVTRIGDRTFALATRSNGTGHTDVIASLGADGQLVTTTIPPLPGPVALGGDPRGLVLVSVPLRGTGSLLRVALEPDGSLRAGAWTALPEIVWGWPGTIASDGERAILSHAMAAPDQTIGGHARYTIDLRIPRVVATEQNIAGDETCNASGCVRYAVERRTDAPARVTFTHRAQGGSEEQLALELNSTCPTFYAFASGEDTVYAAPGDPWRAVRSSPRAPYLREVAIDPTLPPVPGCGSTLYDFPSTARPGVMEGYRSPRRLLRYDAARGVFGASEELPPITEPRSARWAHTDGVIEVVWNGTEGMMHSPTDSSGRRRYFRWWRFEGGQVSLLRFERGRWAALDTTPLALANAEGRFDDAPETVVLQNGPYASVLIGAPSYGEPGWLQPFLGPCP